MYTISNWIGFWIEWSMIYLIRLRNFMEFISIFASLFLTPFEFQPQEVFHPMVNCVVFLRSMKMCNPILCKDSLHFFQTLWACLQVRILPSPHCYRTSNDVTFSIAFQPLINRASFAHPILYCSGHYLLLPSPFPSPSVLWGGAI